MTVPNWPEDLPQFSDVAGFGSGTRDARQITKMERGPAKVRRRGGPGLRPTSLSFTMTMDERARFELFWDEDLAGGVLPFTMPGQMLDSAILMDDDGADLLIDETGLYLLMTDAWLVMVDQDGPSFEALSANIFRMRLNVIEIP